MTVTGPTMVFHRTELPRIVQTKAELEALGDGWADTPAAFYAPETPAPAKPARQKRERAS